MICNKCSYVGCKGGFVGHYKFKVWLFKTKMVRKLREKLKKKLDYTQIEDVQVEDVFMYDYPDFCDAFISSATYKGRDMTDAELDLLNEDRDFVYERATKWIY